MTVSGKTYNGLGTKGRLGKMSVQMVGIEHSNIAGEDRLALVEQLAPGTPVTLVHEPNNEHDSRAVRVYADCRDIGFLSANYQRDRFVELLERGATFSAKIGHNTPYLHRQRDSRSIRDERGTWDWNYLHMVQVEITEESRPTVAPATYARTIAARVDKPTDHYVSVPMRRMLASSQPDQAEERTTSTNSPVVAVVVFVAVLLIGIVWVIAR